MKAVKDLLKKKPPKNEAELIFSCQQIAGFSFSQLASSLDLLIPENPAQRKGWVGQAIELALGTTAGNRSLPDFHHLGIELKTLPMGPSGKPAESTFICSINLLHFHRQQWESSTCFNKLKKILWFPIEGDTDIPFHHRRLGQGFLWSPNQTQAEILKADWIYFNNLISLGQLEEIDARHGDYLQIRPKAANGKSLCDAYDSSGARIKTLPRGFYLRSSFTASLFTGGYS